MINNNKSNGQQFCTTYSPGLSSWGRINILCTLLNSDQNKL